MSFFVFHVYLPSDAHLYHLSNQQHRCEYLLNDVFSSLSGCVFIHVGMKIRSKRKKGENSVEQTELGKTLPRVQIPFFFLPLSLYSLHVPINVLNVYLFLVSFIYTVNRFRPRFARRASLAAMHILC